MANKMNQTNINSILANVFKKHPRGCVAPAANLGGEWIKSAVIKGSGRGKTLGFPTLNLKLKTAQHWVLGDFKNDLKTPPRWHPAESRDDSSEVEEIEYGVYSCKVKIKNQIYKGLLHYGPRPTFGCSKPALEIHVLDFNEEIKPGKKIQFKLLKYLRKIKKFKRKEELVKQIRKDTEVLENS